jgi:hypothetical protein
MTTAEARSDDHRSGLHQLLPSGRSWLVFFSFDFIGEQRNHKLVRTRVQVR